MNVMNCHVLSMLDGASGTFLSCKLRFYKMVVFPNVTPCPSESVPDRGWPTERANQ